MDRKSRLMSPAAEPADPAQTGNRRRLSRIVHDHKGTATVEWHDAPPDYERQVFEIEGADQPTSANHGLSTGSLAIDEPQDTHNPYMRIPEVHRKRAPGQRTDLRKLSAWIKMMRSLEEAKKRDPEDD
jgi:hypothetical protein